ncbi:hypothetical protein [Amycolatopsis orientalis]|uniref:hypothetical protein n=1 Tax=Amycolatopsis orientalis TaxID=31958 RepID=UPI00055D7632|nr:hypothetical protein [Amycolatopsis orientalis]
MKITGFSVVLAAVRAVATDSLAEQAEQISQSAREQGLQVLQVRVDANILVELDPRALTADQVVDAATAAGAHLLYLRRVVLDQDAVNIAQDCLDVGIARTRASKALSRSPAGPAVSRSASPPRRPAPVGDAAPLRDAIGEFTTQPRPPFRWTCHRFDRRSRHTAGEP